MSYRSYGEFVADRRAGQRPSAARVKALEATLTSGIAASILDYPDVKRAERFISELKRFEAEGDMPRLQIVRLPNDHTHGATHRRAHADGLRGR